MLKALNKSAEKTFRRLISGLGLHQSRIIDNTDKTFMPVHIEIIGQQHVSLIVSIAHYYEQHGDLCQDPEMTFLVNDTGVYAMTFQQAIPPIYQEAIRLEDQGVRYSAKLQRDLTSFANDWMKNIQSQQF